MPGRSGDCGALERPVRRPGSTPTMVVGELRPGCSAPRPRLPPAEIASVAAVSLAVGDVTVAAAMLVATTLVLLLVTTSGGLPRRAAPSGPHVVLGERRFAGSPYPTNGATSPFDPRLQRRRGSLGHVSSRRAKHALCGGCACRSCVRQALLTGEGRQVEVLEANKRTGSCLLAAFWGSTRTET